jgi:hypothetical protein
VDVIGFLCVSLGSSTIQLHDSLGRILIISPPPSFISVCMLHILIKTTFIVLFVVVIAHSVNHIQFIFWLMNSLLRIILLQLFQWWLFQILLCLIMWFSFPRADKISERIEDIRVFYRYNFYVSVAGMPRKYNEWCMQSFFIPFWVFKHQNWLN